MCSRKTLANREELDYAPGHHAMHFHLNFGLWFAAQFLEAGILFALFARGWQRQYPRFTSYIIFQLVAEVFLIFAMDRFPYIYYFGYWATMVVTIVLTFAIFYEVVQQVWAPMDARRKLGKAVVWLIVVLIFGQSVIALWTSAAHPSHLDSITSFILSVDRDLRVVVCATGLFILVFLKRLGISWREFVVGIIAGFVLFFAVHLTVATAVAHPTVLHRSTLAAVNSAAYLLATLVWLAYAILSPNVVPGGAVGSMPPTTSLPTIPAQCGSTG